MFESLLMFLLVLAAVLSLSLLLNGVIDPDFHVIAHPLESEDERRWFK